MFFTMPSPPPRKPQNRRPAPPKRDSPSPLIITLGILAGLIVLLIIAANIWTEVLWFNQLGFLQVMGIGWGVRAGLFVLGAALMGGIIWLTLWLAYRNRPLYTPVRSQLRNLKQYRESVDALRKVIAIGAPILLGLFAGGFLASQWETILLWFGRTPFGMTDPEFGYDIGFFVFTYPVIQLFVTFFIAISVLALIAAVVTNVLYSGIVWASKEDGYLVFTRAARIQVFSTAAVLTVLLGINYFLDRFGLLTKTGSRFDGAGYTDINAVMPSKLILAAVSIVVAGMFVFAAVRGTWKIPAIGVGLMVVSGIAIGGIYPALIERFQVGPNQQVLEEPYIQRNINATRHAYDFDDIIVTPYSATTEADPDILREEAQTTASIRLLDPNIVSPAFRQLQQHRPYYGFSDTLNVDRYEIDGELQDTVIAVRELNQEGRDADQRNWVNDHTVFTHGFGVVAAYGNRISSTGQPQFFHYGIPQEGDLGEFQPRIYFGQDTPEYSIVGAPEGTEPWELDYPDDEFGDVTYTYGRDGTSGGPSLGPWYNKVAYALKFRSEQILFSDRVNSESQILYNRDPRDRVSKVAPYLNLDGRVYPAVVDGRVLWIVDGYTTTRHYPYSASRSLDDVTNDSLVAADDSTVESADPRRINYIRNSVKATVDAYSGEVTLYEWDTDDPILKAWSSIYSTSITPRSEISSELMSHLRYPEDLFKVQRALLTQYHVQDARQFFTGQDFWSSPNEPTTEAAVAQPPYYLTLELPTMEEPSFSLTSTFIPAGGQRNILTGFLAVDAETGSQAGQPREGYGQLRLLELPRGTTIPGPGQVQNNFNSDPDVVQTMTLLQQGSSQVRYGNLLTLPMGGSLLYVQPIYVQSATGTQVPLLRRVLVAYGDGDTVGFGNTLDEALDQVFMGAERPDPPDPVDPVDPTDPDPVDPDPTEPPDPVDPGDPTDPRVELNLALQDARNAMIDSDDALRAGDFARYGEAQDRLNEAILRALDAEARINVGE